MSIHTSIIAIIHTMYGGQTASPQKHHTNSEVGGGNIMAWDCFSVYGTGTFQIIAGRMNGKMYQDILDKYLLSSTRMMKMKVHRRGPRSIQDFKTVKNHSDQQRLLYKVFNKL